MAHQFPRCAYVQIRTGVGALTTANDERLFALASRLLRHSCYLHAVEHLDTLRLFFATHLNFPCCSKCAPLLLSGKTYDTIAVT